MVQIFGSINYSSYRGTSTCLFEDSARCSLCRRFYSKPLQIQQNHDNQVDHIRASRVELIAIPEEPKGQRAYETRSNDTSLERGVPHASNWPEICLCKESSRLHFSSRDEVWGLKSNKKRLFVTEADFDVWRRPTNTDRIVCGQY